MTKQARTHNNPQQNLAFYKKICSGFPGGSVVKNPPAKQETWLQYLGREDPLEKEMAPTLVFLPGKSQGQRSLGATVHGVTKELDMVE